MGCDGKACYLTKYTPIVTGTLIDFAGGVADDKWKCMEDGTANTAVAKANEELGKVIDGLGSDSCENGCKCFSDAEWSKPVIVEKGEKWAKTYKITDKCIWKVTLTYDLSYQKRNGECVKRPPVSPEPPGEEPKK